MELPFQLVKEMSGKLNTATFGTHLNETDFPDLIKPLNKSGVALSSIVSYVNYGIDSGFNVSDESVPYYYILQESVNVMGVILNVSSPFGSFHFTRVS